MILRVLDGYESSHTLTVHETYEDAEACETEAIRNDLVADLKLRIAGAIQQWIDRNDVRLTDNTFGGSFARSQECLQTVMTGRFCDYADELAGDYLEGEV